MSWLNKIVPCTTAFAYHGQLLCGDCAEKIASQLSANGVVDNGDSNTFPQLAQGRGGGESDGTNFCGNGRLCENAVSIANRKVGCPLGNPLTSYGRESLGESIKRLMFSNTKFDRLLSRLLRHVWNFYLPDINPPVRAKQPWLKNDMPKSLSRAVRSYERSRRKGPMPVTLCCDTEHAYLVYPNGYQIDFVRVAIGDDGEYEAARIVSIPLGAQRDDVLLDLADLAAEGAWD